jgi:tetratricopeptide (TPR) repeat protein
VNSSSPESVVNPAFLPGAAEQPPSPWLLGAVVSIVIAIGFSPWLLTKMAREAPLMPPVQKGADMSSPQNWGITAKWHGSRLMHDNINLATQSQYAARMQRERKFATAVKAYTKLIQGTGKYRAENYISRGQAYLSLGRFDLAVSDFNNAIALDPVEPDAFRFRSDAYRQLGKPDLAQQDMNQSMILNH